MRITLILLSIIMISCNAKKTSPDKAQSSAHQTNQKVTKSDSVQIDTSTDFVTGQFDFTKREDFIQVDSQYANKTIYLHKKTYEAFKAMADSAQEDGVSFTIISGTRNYADQKSIWERKWRASDSTDALGKANGILEFSSMPMTSRHHWGTDIDLNNLNNSYFESGQGKKEYKWLKAHANDFGFYQPYTDKSKNGRTGYNEEKWHWSYMPLADKYLQYYNRHLTNSDIQGFKGSDQAAKIDMVKNYVNGLSVKIKKYNS